MDFFKKILVNIGCSFMFLAVISCEKEERLLQPEVRVWTDNLSVSVGEEVLFHFEGDVNFITFYPGTASAEWGIPVKYYQQLLPDTYSYIYTEPGRYHARFVFKNAKEADELEQIQDFDIEVMAPKN